MKKIILAFCLNLLFCLSVSADTSVWTVQTAGNTLYLGGTCHILRKSDYPLPAEFLEAYQDSDLIVLETDLAELQSPEIQAQIINKGRYSPGKSLQDVLSAKAYNALQEYCSKQGLDVALFEQFKPPLVYMTLFALELQRLGINHTGIDEYFYQKAQKDGKKVIKLESAQKQFDYILSMGKGKESRFILHVLEELKQAEQKYIRLIQAWKEGDKSQLTDLTIMQMQKKYPQIYANLIVKRNQQWLPKIEKYCQNPSSEFVLVGAGHLVGEHGIIRMLQKRGYSVHRY